MDALHWWRQGDAVTQGTALILLAIFPVNWAAGTILLVTAPLIPLFMILTGIGAELGWTSMSIYHGPRHEPHVRLDEKGLALLHHIGGTRVLLSVAHSDTVAIAFAAIVRCDDSDP